MTRLFGTDGVRGEANSVLTPQLALALGEAAAQILAPNLSGSNLSGSNLSGPDSLGDSDAKPIAVIGRDPRISGEFLEAAVAAGIAAAGVNVLVLGVLPTPAVAYLTGKYGAAFGVMISASHNPMPDNGIKIFGAGGHKLDDATEDAISLLVSAPMVDRPTGAQVGTITRIDAGLADYVSHILGSVTTSLAGLTVVVDCAHGAAAVAAPMVYEQAGAKVIALHADPNGININDGVGSTHMFALQAAVVANGADLGLGHDGDADRCLAVDANGEIIDGDAIMAILAVAFKRAGTLKDNTLVATVMSNLGLHLLAKEHEINLVTTDVGDRYVLEELRRNNFSLGGEQSGHIILPEFATTGDGILTGLEIMAQLAETGRSLKELAAVLTVLPQVLVNVSVTEKTVVAQDSSVLAAVAEAEVELAERGRVLLRPSGTEQLVRVMVEAETADQANRIAATIAAVVAKV